MKRLFVSIILISIFLMAIAEPAAASELYADNYQSSVYGLRAYIYTPNSAPSPQYLTGQANWVGVNAGYGHWIQTGWMYNSNNANALPYTEYNIDGIHAIQGFYGTQSWGYSKHYQCSYNNSTGCWDTFIDGDRKVSVYSSNLPTAPTAGDASSEVHDSTTSVLDTVFYYVEYMNSSGSWNKFDQNNQAPSSPNPYQVTKDCPWYFRCYGP